MTDWTADPRPLSECLDAWAEAHGITWGKARWLAEQLGVPQSVINEWRQGRREPALSAAGPIRRLMTLIDAQQPS